MYTDWGI